MPKKSNKPRISESFEQYIQRPENYGKTANNLLRGYRSIGGSVGNVTGKAIIREVLEREFQPKKATRKPGLKTKPKTKPGMYGRHYKSSKMKRKTFMTDPYVYIVSYYAKNGESLEPELLYMTIGSSRKLTDPEIIAYLFIKFDEAKTEGRISKQAQYTPMEIVAPGDEDFNYDDYPIRILRRIYNDAPTPFKRKKI